MDPTRNPFSPGAGSPPPDLAGRSAILDQAMLALARVKAGKSERSLFLVGLRGVGKTVLLNRIARLAENEGYETALIETSENSSFLRLLLTNLRRLLYRLKTEERASQAVKRGFSVLRSFLKGAQIKIGDMEFSLGNSDPGTGAADSGDLENDLAELLVALGEAALDQKTAIAIIIDEMQYLKVEEMAALILAAHKISQKSLPLLIFGAGLPQLVGQTGNAKSYAERLFNFPLVGALQKQDALEALQNPAQQENAEFTQEALDEILRITQGYPYFLQEWGYQAWNHAPRSPITLDDVRNASPFAVKQLDQNFFRVRFDRLTPREKTYLRALAELGDGSHRSGDVADLLNTSVNSIAPLRDGLIKKGMIYSPSHGDTVFTVPLFEDFMKRTIPDFTPPH